MYMIDREHDVENVNLDMQNESNTVTLVVTVEDLARLLAIGRNTAYTLVRSGKIRSIKVGRKYLIPKTAVEEYLNAAS